MEIVSPADHGSVAQEQIAMIASSVKSLCIPNA
jgi:hypothetical protein